LSCARRNWQLKFGDQHSSGGNPLNQLLFWVLFNLFVLGMLVLDLGFLQRPGHTVRFREALAWSIAWIVLACVFAGIVYFRYGHATAVEFVTGYVVELSLSVDNLFIFLLIFRYFRVAPEHQHKVLFWGIVGALVMRAIFIVVGIGLIRRFHWITYIFGALLVYSGIKLFRQNESAIKPESNPVLRLFRRWVPVTEDYEGDKFVVRRMGLYATPLLVVLVVVETTDLLFATDSIPAVLAITLKPFIVYTSNVFAILGLRSMFFVLAGMMKLFHYLHYGLSVVLIFIGAKMLTSDYFQISTSVALGVVAGVLLVSVLASLLNPRSQEH
jgi:tellurite resistance protein TerC